MTITLLTCLCSRDRHIEQLDVITFGGLASVTPLSLAASDKWRLSFRLQEYSARYQHSERRR